MVAVGAEVTGGVATVAALAVRTGVFLRNARVVAGSVVPVVFDCETGTPVVFDALPGALEIGGAGLGTFAGAATPWADGFGAGTA